MLPDLLVELLQMLGSFTMALTLFSWCFFRLYTRESPAYTKFTEDASEQTGSGMPTALIHSRLKWITSRACRKEAPEDDADQISSSNRPLSLTIRGGSNLWRVRRERLIKPILLEF